MERAVSGFGLAFPPLAAVGALFTMNAASGAVKDIVPLGLSMVQQRIRHLRESVERLGLVSQPKARPDFIDAFSKAVFWGGRTLEYALVRAADGYAVWGDAAEAARLFQRGVEAGQPHAEIATNYINLLPALIDQRTQAGDARAAANYKSFAHQLRADPRLSALATGAARRWIDDLGQTMEDSAR